MTADLLRRAAAKLRDPYLCNWDSAVAHSLAVLFDFEAGEWDEYGTPRQGIVAVAQAVLGVPVHEEAEVQF